MTPDPPGPFPAVISPSIVPPSRHRDLETIQQATRARIPGAAVAWLAALRGPLEELTRAALSGETGDEDFRRMVEDFSARLPGMMDDLDHDALGELMEESMGAAMAAGLSARARPAIEDSQSTIDNPQRKAKLPWETEAWLAGQGRGKRCGNSWIPRWKQCGKDDPRDLLNEKTKREG